MGNDVTWWKQQPQQPRRKIHNQDVGTDMPGDTDAPDIVGPTGEEMPEVAHDNGPEHLPRESDDTQ
jgi:hypothetical protein